MALAAAVAAASWPDFVQAVGAVAAAFARLVGETSCSVEKRAQLVLGPDLREADVMLER